MKESHPVRTLKLWRRRKHSPDPAASLPSFEGTNDVGDETVAGVGAATDPPIFVAQNTPDAQRRIAAQARLYSDAKELYFARLAAIAILAVASSVAALMTADGARTALGAGGGVLLLVLSLVGGDIEKRRRLQAAAIQEEFDTGVFRLPWNSMEAERPSPIVIARAAERYRGGREKDWYPDTHGTHRPFDVLICQSTNLGWGAATHRTWAWTLLGFLIALAAALSVIAWASKLVASDVVTALSIPALAPVKELIDQIRAHLATARDKEAAEAKINAAWSDGMRGIAIPTEELLRTIQNKVLSLRQRNHYVPDWLDKLLRRRSETAMRASAADRVAEAARNAHG